MSDNNEPVSLGALTFVAGVAAGVIALMYFDWRAAVVCALVGLIAGMVIERRTK